MANYFALAKRWLDARGLEHPKDGNYDSTLYLIAEHRFLDEWRDEKHFLPFNVLPDYSVVTKGKMP